MHSFPHWLIVTAERGIHDMKNMANAILVADMS